MIIYFNKRLAAFLYIMLMPILAYADTQTVEADPKNTAEFTCNDFQEKAKNCENYTCQTPYSLDLSVRTQWEILGKDNQRCKISHTIDNMGLKDENGNPMPITKTCNYDEIGIQKLNNLFDNMQGNYFPANTEIVEGAHDCTLTSNGQPIHSSDEIEDQQPELSQQQE